MKSKRWFSLILLAAVLSPTGCATKDVFKERLTLGSGKRPPVDIAEEPVPVADQRRNMLLARARSLEAEKSDAAAADVYRKLLAESPDHPEACHRLALLYSRMGRLQDAEPYYRRALALKPADAAVHCDVGYACYLQGQWAEAEGHFRRALDLDPEFKRAHVNLGLLWARSGRTDEALAEFSQAGCTATEAKCNVAFAALMNEDWPRAAALYDQALAEQPGLQKAAAGLETVQRMQAQAEPRRLAASSGPAAPAAAAETASAAPHRPVSYQAARPSVSAAGSYQ